MTDDFSIQARLYPDFTCFGCGHANPAGFHLRSFRDAEAVVARHTTGLEHDNGFGFVNGGVVTTLLDCHSAALVVDEALRRGWTSPGDPATFVTAGFEVRFLRPTPLAEPLELTATLVSAEDEQMVVAAEISNAGKVRADMTSTWRRFRPR